jgi:hypothetical protein
MKLAAFSYDSRFGGDGRIYTSSDSGESWRRTSAPSNTWTSVASSSDGTNLVAASLGAYGGGIYTSTDSGVTWIRCNTPANSWVTVVSSADGVRLAAVAEGSGNGFYTYPMYTSTNSGATWNLSTSFVNISCLAASADLSKLVVATAGADLTGGGHNPIYISADFGASWVTTFSVSLPNDWYSVSCSSNGETIVLAGDEGVFFSTDSGVTWSSSRAPYYVNRPIPNVACSGDGKLVAAVFNDANANGGIYTLQLPLPPPPPLPLPQLGISTRAARLILSWLVPSSSFGLQQNSDLTTTNWTDMQITPSLNFTNLNDQVIVSPTNGQCFYRLKQQ